ncbi:exodeoxyribonuclease VII large subunit [Colwellia maritima]|uniref:exodeoxyribonuclease VII large subunit n=1 Tax=Colwellia maritima TaxID=2912588 RepID=UPI00308410C1
MTTPKELEQRLSRVSPNKQITTQQANVTQLAQRLVNAQQNNLLHKSELFVHLIEQLQLVSPLATIARGYGIIRGSNTKVVNSVTQVSINDEINIQVTDGTIKAAVIE